MTSSYQYTEYKETGFFSKLVTDYIENKETLQPFYNFRPDRAGIEAAITERQKHNTDRKLLSDTLRRQYAGLAQSPLVTQNLDKLADPHTLTICTAHQPNLMTGYLYFFYKILHAIKLANELTDAHPGMHFVPVYYMGSEDNDLDELGVFSFRGTTYRWDGGGQKGAVGRMDTRTLKPLLKELLRNFGPPGQICDDLAKTITEAYTTQPTMGQATRYLVNELFGRYGLLVLDPDDAAFKKAFTPVLRDELLRQSSYPVLQEQIGKLSLHYKIQAHPRELNLFYLDQGVRERIVYEDNKWRVHNTSLSFSQEEILNLLDEHPECFSPNVMLRGLLQETILPNAVFIGGGAEVAYWMQLKTLFTLHGVFYPCILLRQSVLWATADDVATLDKTGLQLTDLFAAEAEMVRNYMTTTAANNWETTQERKEMALIMDGLRAKAARADGTLDKAAAAAQTRIERELTKLEQKMLRAEKRKHEIQIIRLVRVRNKLFPGGSLQERKENFLELYLEYGPAFTEITYMGIQPISNQFLIVVALNT